MYGNFFVLGRFFFGGELCLIFGFFSISVLLLPFWLGLFIIFMYGYYNLWLSTSLLNGQVNERFAVKNFMVLRFRKKSFVLYKERINAI